MSNNLIKDLIVLQKLQKLKLLNLQNLKDIAFIADCTAKNFDGRGKIHHGWTSN